MPPSRELPIRLVFAAVVALMIARGVSNAVAAPATSSTAPSSGPGKSARSPGSTSARKPTTAELKQKIDEQRALIEQEQRRLDEQSRLMQEQNANVDSLRRSMDEMRQTIAGLQRQIEFYQAQVPDSAYRATLERRLSEVEKEAAQVPELPPDTVTASFPNSIRIPGTDAAIKFGGRVRASFVLTLDPLGTDDRFLTNSIPVADTVMAGEARRTNFSARTSRLNFEFRTPAGAGQVRSFIEGDFVGNAATANVFRLRHAYAQYLGLIAGQTWSTFSDPEITPQDLDFEGLSSENVIRQPQVRYWFRYANGARLAFAAETPAVSASGGVGVNLVPDLVARIIRRDERGGHWQVAGVLRQIRVQPDSFPGKVDSDVGWGATVSGVVIIPQHGLTDRFAFQANGGAGVARYINDLNSLGGTDAAVDPANGNAEALPVFGWYVDYEHEWYNWKDWRDRRLRSCILWSVVSVDNLGFQPPSAYHTTNRIAGNVIMSPNSRIDVGLEYIYGRRENKDGRHASANQIQVVTIVNF